MDEPLKGAIHLQTRSGHYSNQCTTIPPTLPVIIITTHSAEHCQMAACRRKHFIRTKIMFRVHRHIIAIPSQIPKTCTSTTARSCVGVVRYEKGVLQTLPCQFPLYDSSRKMDVFTRMSRCEALRPWMHSHRIKRGGNKFYCSLCQNLFVFLFVYFSCIFYSLLCTFFCFGCC